MFRGCGVHSWANCSLRFTFTAFGKYTTNPSLCSEGQHTQPSALNAATETLSFLLNRTLTVSHTNLEVQVRRH